MNNDVQEPDDLGNGNARSPITEADLHGYVDGQLAPARIASVEHFLATHPEERARVLEWEEQNKTLRRLLSPVMRCTRSSRVIECGSGSMRSDCRR